MDISSHVRGARKKWPELVRRWYVRCPGCAVVWLVVGARENDYHVCKGCGHGFDIKLSGARGDEPTPRGDGSKFT